MPRKKKLPPLLTPEQAEKERKPAVTVGMGLKQSKVSADNWKAQIHKERQIRAEWIRTHAPELDQQEQESVRRDAEHRKVLEAERELITERNLLKGGVSKEGQGRFLYMKERLKKAPQEKFHVPQTESQMLGWQCQSSDLVKSRLTTPNNRSTYRPPRSNNAKSAVDAELEEGGWLQITAAASERQSQAASLAASKS